MQVLSNIPRKVLVTGAAKRLGRAIALELASHGYSVAIHYRSSAEEAEQTRVDCAAQAQQHGHTNCQFATLHGDLSDEATTRQLVPQAAELLGGLDAVVNSASLFAEDTAASFTYAQLQRHMASNVAAPLVLAQALHSHLQSRQQPPLGCVVNLLDQKLWNQNPDFMSYTLSKAALEVATTTLAMALAPLLRVVGVAPGLTLTSHLLSQAQFEALHHLSPLGRSSEPQHIASAVRFALENSAITGSSLLVDGGQHLIGFARDFSKMV